MNVPTTVFWGVTNKCNLNCAHCYLGQSQEKMRLSREAALKFTQWLHDGGVETVLLMGGEPLLYPYLHDVVKKAGRHGYSQHVGVLTNGQLLRKHVVDKLADSGVSAVQVSIDGLGSEYKKIRGVEFCKVDEGIGHLKERGILTQAKFTINRKNLNAFDDVWRYCLGRGVLLGTSLVLEMGNAQSGLIPMPNEYFSFFVKSFELKKEREKLKKRTFVLPDFSIEEYLQTGEPYTGCVAGRGICGITAYGKFVPCIYLSGLDVVKMFGIEPPAFNEAFLDVFNTHPLFRLFRDEASEQFGCPIRRRLDGRDRFSVYEFIKWERRRKAKESGS